MRREGWFLQGAGLLAVLAISAPGAERAASTIFAFDDHTIPYKNNLYLTMQRVDKYPGSPVVRRGPAGAPDSFRAQFYGSVLKTGETFRMWYAACSYDPKKSRGTWSGNPDYNSTWNIAYAESRDGVHWTKPGLGLTSFNGNRHNNLVQLPEQLDAALVDPIAAFVLDEPEDPDPSRRYKMALYGRYFNSDPKKKMNPATIYPLYSADGLRWKLAVPPPRKKVFDEKETPFTTEWVFEIGGFYKFDGIYYVAGQQVSPDTTMPNGDPAGRTMVTHWSGDFAHWSQESSFSFQRYGYRSARINVEEAHEPASVWNRGNVLLGLYGLWHGSQFQKYWRLDLGFLVSNDGIHFREPIADHVFVKAGEDGAWDQNGLIQGQGFVNVGEKTYIYYGTWDPSVGEVTPGEIGMATLARDRFGYLSTHRQGKGSFNSTPLVLPPAGAALSINAEGLSEESYLRAELVDKFGAAIPGYSGAAAGMIRKPGFAEKVVWPQSGLTSLPDRPFRLRLYFEGASPRKIRFYAAYVQ